MGNTVESQKSLEDLAPGKGSVLTSVLNGIGNATMLAAIPLAFFADVIPKGNRKAFFGITGVAVAVGAMWGWSEAKQIRKYRSALTGEISGLRQKVETLEAERDSWQKKLAEDRKQDAAATLQISS